MSELWDIGRTYPWDKYSEEDVREEMREYRPRFEENHGQEIPIHPYKIYREIVESNQLSVKEKAAVHYLKDEYAEKWKEVKEQEVSE